MFMDYRPQQPGEHDFVYAARILRACATGFDAMMANGSFSLAELRDMRARMVKVAALTNRYPPPAYGADAGLVPLSSPAPAAPAILAHTISVEGSSREHAERLLGEKFNEWAVANPGATLHHIFEPTRYDRRYGDHNYDRFHSAFTFFYREAAGEGKGATAS